MYASKEESSRIEYIQKHHNRITRSDTLRFLINQEYEKILNSNKATAIK